MEQQMTHIRGDEVLLRPLQEGDLEESLRVWTPELRHMYGGSLTAPAGPIEERRRGKRAWFDRVQRGEEGHCFAIEVDGRHIGFAILDGFDEPGRRARWRGGIENSEYWGRGYGTETIRLMLRYAFETLELHRVDLRVAEYNVRAIRCYEKCGFRREGVLRDSFFVDGRRHNDVLMAILREEWETMLPEERAGAKAVSIRSYRPDDYGAVVELWGSVGFNVDERDSREALQQKLIRDPELFLLAEAHRRVIGTAIGSWDGRRAWVYRVAVEPSRQGQGIGTQLMVELESRLARLGARSAALLVLRENEPIVRLYRRLGYEAEDGVAFMKKVLEPGEDRDNGP
jgi:RimJ/RimL family protein N-acetyltransferase